MNNYMSPQYIKDEKKILTNSKKKLVKGLSKGPTTELNKIGQDLKAQRFVILNTSHKYQASDTCAFEPLVTKCINYY